MERIYHKVVTVTFFLLGQLPKKEIFFFESFHGKQYSDNPRAVYEYLRIKHPKIKCVWAVKRGYEASFIAADVPFVYRMGLKWLLTMPRAKWWIFNTRMPRWMRKPRGTTYVQTWHGTPLKKLGLDIEDVKMPGTDTVAYRQNFIAESSRWDYLISPNSYSTEIFKSAFGYQGNILEIGYPRNDLLLDEEHIEEVQYKVRTYLGISSEKKCILYAPTWRDDEFYRKGLYKFNNVFPFDEILQENPEAIILLRTHYLVKNEVDFQKYHGRVIDCSAYPDVKELYLVSDLLITDYSSVMFDFAYLKKPMLFYMYDFIKYADDIRGFYFDPRKELPEAIIENRQILVNSVKDSLSHFQWNESYQKFYDKFCLSSVKSAVAQLVDDELLKYKE